MKIRNGGIYEDWKRRVLSRDQNICLLRSFMQRLMTRVSNVYIKIRADVENSWSKNVNEKLSEDTEL